METALEIAERRIAAAAAALLAEAERIAGEPVAIIETPGFFTRKLAEETQRGNE